MFKFFRRHSKFSAPQVEPHADESADSVSASLAPASDSARNASLLQRMLRAVRSLFNKPLLGRLDRYIIYKFLSTYIFLILIIVMIVVVVDFNERIDKFSRSQVSMQKVFFDYYLNYIPYVANLYSALFVFVAVIFFTSNLAGHSEIIAMKSTGMSFKRLLRPYLFSAALIAATSFALGAYVIPKSNVKRVAFSNRYLKKTMDPTSIDNVQLQVDTGVVAYITHFDNITKSGYGFSLDKFVDKKLVSHLTAESIQYDTLSDHRFSWTLHQYNIRTLKGMREKLESGDRIDTTIIMEPNDFFFVRDQEETMTLTELKDFIDRQAMRGSAGASKFEVEYHKRIASPFAAFILTLIAVSLSSEKRKGGIGANLGFGLALSFAYILFQTVSSAFAVSGQVPTALAVWIPNILFSVIALVLVWRTPQ